MQRRALTLMLLLVSAAFAQPALAADEDLWALLERGGQVVLMRHALTTPGVGDPEGMSLRECATQRNLSDEGRAHAAQVGEAIRARGVKVARLISSPWCRCLETSKLVFGRNPEVSFALANLFGRASQQVPQIADLRSLITPMPPGANLFLVTHGSTIAALTGVSPATAEMVILTPQPGGRFTVAGRLEVPAR